MRPLHQHGPQIPVSFLTDAHLRLALTGISAPRAQPQKTTDLATLQKTVWVFYGQHIRQRDLRSYTLHLLEQGHFRIHFLGDFLHPRVVFLDALVQRFDFFEQRLQNLPQLGAQGRGQLPAHFGEAAIQAWFRDNWKTAAREELSQNDKLKVLVEDFLQYDGNPQGTRILTRLQGLTKNDRNLYGMDLTFSQVLTALKYPRGPKDLPSRWKSKPGFFESERPRMKKAWDALGFEVHRRFPLAYLVEAADDISYCISDMEDGIDQGVFTVSDFFSEMQVWIDKQDRKQPSLVDLRKTAQKRSDDAKRTKEPGEAKDHFMRFKTDFSRTMIEEAAKAYGDGSASDIRDGSRLGLLDGTDADGLLETLKGVARKFLYIDEKVQRPFLAGLRIVHGILDQYGELLELTREDFTLPRNAWKSADRTAVHKKKLHTLLPLLDRLPAHYLDVYDSSLKEAESLKEWGEDAWEWFCRAHLIVDYLSGMTDDFAYRSYQVISGAKLE